jgi:AraC-like DNA-binding protein
VALSAIEENESRIMVKQSNALWEAIARQAADPDFGLHFGEAVADLGGGHVLFLVMMNCPTVARAIEKVARYHGLLSDFVQLQLTQQGSYAYLSWEANTPDKIIDRHHSESIAVTLWAALRGLTKDSIQLVQVRFHHSRPQDTTEHQRILRCPLVFAQPKNELVIRREDLALPVFLADPELLEMLEQYARRLLAKLNSSNTWADRVIHSLGRLLIQGESPSISAVALDLAISTRHLQSHLKVEGTTYQKLLDQVRKELALDYLEQAELTRCDIAFMLGFSNQSAFNHAFKRWMESSPTEYLKG